MGFQLDQTARQRSNRLRIAVAALALIVSASTTPSVKERQRPPPSWRRSAAVTRMRPGSPSGRNR